MIVNSTNKMIVNSTHKNPIWREKHCVECNGPSNNDPNKISISIETRNTKFRIKDLFGQIIIETNFQITILKSSNF